MSITENRHPNVDDVAPDKPEEEASRPPGAGGKEGPDDSDGRDGPYSEEPESPDVSASLPPSPSPNPPPSEPPQPPGQPDFPKPILPGDPPVGPLPDPLPSIFDSTTVAA